MASQFQWTVALPLAADTGKDVAVHINTSGQLAISGAADELCIGTTERDGLAGERVTVALFHPARRVVANGALAVGVRVDTAAGGKVGAAATGAFINLITTAADGDQTNIVPCTHGAA